MYICAYVHAYVRAYNVHLCMHVLLQNCTNTCAAQIIYFTLHNNVIVLQVAMGQGQATVAIQLLRECASKGHWLCLKNLHLVTGWLPALEKVNSNEVYIHLLYKLKFKMQ